MIWFSLTEPWTAPEQSTKQSLETESNAVHPICYKPQPGSLKWRNLARHLGSKEPAGSSWLPRRWAGRGGTGRRGRRRRATGAQRSPRRSGTPPPPSPPKPTWSRGTAPQAPPLRGEEIQELETSSRIQTTPGANKNAKWAQDSAPTRPGRRPLAYPRSHWLAGGRGESTRAARSWREVRFGCWRKGRDGAGRLHGGENEERKRMNWRLFLWGRQTTQQMGGRRGSGWGMLLCDHARW